MENKVFTGKQDFLFNNPIPECQKRELRPPKRNLAGVNNSGISSYSKSFLTTQMRLYVAKAIIDSGREIKCEKCGKYEDLEFHHTKYEAVRIKDIQILCSVCHRNSEVIKENCRSKLRTVFKNGQRFCEVSRFSFEY